MQIINNDDANFATSAQYTQLIKNWKLPMQRLFDWIKVETPAGKMYIPYGRTSDGSTPVRRIDIGFEVDKMYGLTKAVDTGWVSNGVLQQMIIGQGPNTDLNRFSALCVILSHMKPAEKKTRRVDSHSYSSKIEQLQELRSK